MEKENKWVKECITNYSVLWRKSSATGAPLLDWIVKKSYGGRDIQVDTKEMPSWKHATQFGQKAQSQQGGGQKPLLWGRLRAEWAEENASVGLFTTGGVGQSHMWYKQGTPIVRHTSWETSVF